MCLTLNIHKTEGRDANLPSNDDKAGGTVGENQPLRGYVPDNLSPICALDMVYGEIFVEFKPCNTKDIKKNK